ncbi:phage tail sheath family protein [Arthrobacter antioxidans]|uniref:phage tail sheath family protein n=1 Tax=Arthrobacter antioxidans TaxID=2895818 RepID=UPI001FFF2109|nr:phage tail sheath C-terminal domain-containing protein [Arthrobacter antioxidans]
MPVSPTYPGVYIEEVPSNVRTLVGVATSITAFIGRTRRGPENEPVRIQSYADFERRMGGLWQKSSVSYAVQQYFLNGGADAVIVRVTRDAQAAIVDLTDDGGMVLEADSPGEWGNLLQVAVDYQTADEADGDEFNLFVRETGPGDRPGTTVVVGTEIYRNLSIDPLSARHATTVLAQESRLLNISTLGAVPPASDTDDDGNLVYTPLTGGMDGLPVTAEEIATKDGLASAREGLYALDKADLFNLLAIPPFDPENEDAISGASIKAVQSAALVYCRKRRAMLLIDPPLGWDTVEDAEAGAQSGAFEKDPNTVIYFPRVKLADPLKENRLSVFAPSGVMAGVIARTDATRGVWKAPAGTEATLVGVQDLAYNMTDGENGRLNPLGVNCLRTFNVIGRVAWGARTTRGADQFGSEWKYISVRRLALYIEESLYRGTQWAVFEPNDEPLWAQLRLNITSFMHDLFRKGAFQGNTPRSAYLVKCDGETTTQGDIDRGIVNIVVGFAPLKPAEFVIIKITQLAGQDES